jgi:hypothetical protein
MQQQLLIKPSIALKVHKKLTFNIPDIDSIFPGFRTGDFAVLYGPKAVTSLLSLFCFRAQLPAYLGGLESNVVFIDCASSSSLLNINQRADLQQLGSQATLEKIHNMRVYTAYRLTTIIMEKLQHIVETTDAKLVVISDIAAPFLNDNVDDQEAKTVYNQIMSYLANFARKLHLIIIATYLSHESNRRNSFLQEITNAKANTLLRFTKTPYTKEVELEKHPSYMLGVADLTSENHILTDFIGTTKKNRNYFIM